MNGICLIAVGEKTYGAAEQCITSIRKVNRKIPITVFGDKVLGPDTVNYQVSLAPVPVDKQMVMSRELKLTLDLNTPYPYTLYMDVDTRMAEYPTVLFEALADGYDMAICPSTVQGDKWAVTAQETERESTLDMLGFQPYQLQCGVFSFRRTNRVKALFAAWRREYAKFQDVDQLAFMRALYQKPVKLCLLSNVFNGGSVIKHLFGSMR